MPSTLFSFSFRTFSELISFYSSNFYSKHYKADQISNLQQHCIKYSSFESSHNGDLFCIIRSISTVEVCFVLVLVLKCNHRRDKKILIYSMWNRKCIVNFLFFTSKYANQVDFEPKDYNYNCCFVRQNCTVVLPWFWRVRYFNVNCFMCDAIMLIRNFYCPTWYNTIIRLC